MARTVLLKVRRDLTINWQGVVPAAGELTYSTDDYIFKIGDGSSTWQALPGINADKLDGNHAGSFSLTSHTHESFDLSNLSTDHSYKGVYVSGQTAGETLGFGNAVYLKGTDSKWYKTKNDADLTTSGEIGVVIDAAGIATDAVGNILKLGYVRHDAWTLTVGGAIYIGGTSGAFTQTLPSDIGTFVRKVGYAITANTLWFLPDVTTLENEGEMQLNMGDITDVDTTGSEEGAFLNYNGTTWVPINHGDKYQVMVSGAHDETPSWGPVDGGSA